MEWIANQSLIAGLVALGLAICLCRDLLAVALLASGYSLLCAVLYTVLDAVDVAFTEAAVGAAISTVPLIMTLRLTGRSERATPFKPLALLTALGVAGEERETAKV